MADSWEKVRRLREMAKSTTFPEEADAFTRRADAMEKTLGPKPFPKSPLPPLVRNNPAEQIVIVGGNPMRIRGVQRAKVRHFVKEPLEE